MYRFKDKELMYIALAGISVVFAYPALYWLALELWCIAYGLIY